MKKDNMVRWLHNLLVLPLLMAAGVLILVAALLNNKAAADFIATLPRALRR